ncbi:MAG: hypothetical protein O7F12_17200 [Nitrospirae bacterium]|nr:hypothetical protein [Nitrospirota bacterium]
MKSFRSYPAETTIHGDLYRFEKILKEDFFSVNVLYRNEQGAGYVLKLSDFRFIFGWLCRPLAGWMSRREYRTYQRLSDVPGIPQLGPRYGWRGFYHSFIEGKTLHELKGGGILPDNFFDQLNTIMTEVHRRRVFYLDSNKCGNIILSDEGTVYLIDFQICITFPPLTTWLGRRLDRLFNRLTQEDIYHVYKHKNYFQPHLMTEEERPLAQRSSLNQTYHRSLLQVYLKLKRPIYPHGSNEIIWYKWKKMKNKEPQTP